MVLRPRPTIPAPVGHSLLSQLAYSLKNFHSRSSVAFSKPLSHQ
jgi:hypothetical protein